MHNNQENLTRNEKFLQKHPWCCLCGGSVAATTIEHAPPKVLFVNKEVPAATHRMPACARCNNGSGPSDQVAALACLIQASVHKDIPDEYMDKLIDGVKNNSPDAFLAIANGPSYDVPLKVAGKVDYFSRVEIDPTLYTNWLNPWAAKQAYALYYLHSEGRILPPASRVMVQWYTNEHIVDELTPDTLLQSLGSYGELKQGAKNSELQYSYKWQLDKEIGCFILMLQDASMVLLGIIHDPEQLEAYPDWTLFSTNAERGIHLVE